MTSSVFAAAPASASPAAEPSALAARVALAAILLLAASLRVWALDSNGFGAEYYAAGVRTMAQDWRLFYFNGFDPAGFVSLDKPPVAFWIQALSVRLFGFSPWAVLLPQALAGVAGCALLHSLVAGRFGAGAGLLAAVFLALTPVAVAVDRSNITDAWLVFFLVAAAWTFDRALDGGTRGRLLAAFALLGVAFNVKMLAGWLLAPAFGLAWLFGARAAWPRKIADLSLAGVVLLATSMWWVLAYDAVGRGSRPYAGSSKTDSMLELVAAHNGLERFVLPGRDAAARPAERPPSRLFDDVPVGPLRLADPHLAAQAGWLLPLALVGAWFGIARASSSPARASAGVLAAWLALGLGLFSVTGGIFHAYYLSLLGPPTAALAAVALARSHRAPLVLAAAVAATAVWQLRIVWPHLAESWAVAAVGAGALAALAPLSALAPRWLRFAPAAPAIAAFVVLAAPLAWSLSSILAPASRTLPSANLSRLTGRSVDATLDRRFSQMRLVAPTEDAALAAFLMARHDGRRFALATANAKLAAPVIVATGLPVMALGGYAGDDPILTFDQFLERVSAGEVRYVLLSGPTSFGFGPANEARRRAFVLWVRANGKPVPPAHWRSTASPFPVGLYEIDAGRPAGG